MGSYDLNISESTKVAKPIASVSSQAEYESLNLGSLLSSATKKEKILLADNPTACFKFDGICLPCTSEVGLEVDMNWGGLEIEGVNTPNWRERLVCPKCKMNNRQRLIAGLIKPFLEENIVKIYFMESVTPIYQWAARKVDGKLLTGSEYLGPDYEGGQIYKGIRHEDVENLSFANDSLGLIVSNDVFEHVPNPNVALTECYRVLNKGGELLATFPFYIENATTSARAKFENGDLVHLKERQFHGNPVDESGSLVFTDFGWDILDIARDIGFFSCVLEMYSSVDFGHLGGAQLVFRFIK